MGRLICWSTVVSKVVKKVVFDEFAELVLATLLNHEIPLWLSVQRIKFMFVLN